MTEVRGPQTQTRPETEHTVSLIEDSNLGCRCHLAGGVAEVALHVDQLHNQPPVVSSDSAAVLTEQSSLLPKRIRVLAGKVKARGE